MLSRQVNKTVDVVSVIESLGKVRILSYYKQTAQWQTSTTLESIKLQSLQKHSFSVLSKVKDSR